MFDTLCHDADETEKFLASINHGHRPTAEIFLYPHDERLVDADNKLIEPYENFQNFIVCLQSHEISPNKVTLMKI